MVTARADHGGGPEHVLRLVESLPEGIEAVIAAPREAPYWERFGEVVGGANLIEIPKRRVTLQAWLALRREVIVRRVDIIHSHGKGAGVLARPLKLATAAKIVHTFHGVHIGDYGAAQRQAYLALERALSLLTDAAISVSPSERDEIVALRLIPAQRLHVICNGVRIPSATASPVRTGEPFRVVAVVRYRSQQKNPELVLEIAESLRALAPEQLFEFHLLGGGDGLAEFRELVERRDLSQTVRPLGFVDQPLDVMRTAQVFLSTSRWEGMPIALLEAASLGLPIVATNVAGNRDCVVDGVTGHLFTLNHCAAAAEHLATFAREPARRNEMGTAARHLVEHEFSAASMAERTVQLYRKLLRPAGQDTDRS